MKVKEAQEATPFAAEGDRRFSKCSEHLVQEEESARHHCGFSLTRGSSNFAALDLMTRGGGSSSRQFTTKIPQWICLALVLLGFGIFVEGAVQGELAALGAQ